MQTDNTPEPLYKRLNKERTQGNWFAHSFCKNKPGWPVYSDKTGKRNPVIWGAGENDLNNAKYAALACNNLHKLAEALTESIKSLEALKGGDIWKQWDDLAIKKAKEALNNIS
jgi:hypothetical protein